MQALKVLICSDKIVLLQHAQPIQEKKPHSTKARGIDFLTLTGKRLIYSEYKNIFVVLKVNASSKSINLH